MHAHITSSGRVLGAAPTHRSVHAQQHYVYQHAGFGPRTSAHRTRTRSSQQDASVDTIERPEVTVDDSSPSTSSSSNGNGNGAVAAMPLSADDLELTWSEPTNSDKFWTSFKLAFARPWRRFKNGSVLAIKIEGEVPDQSKSWLEPGNSMPQLCDGLRKAALDPRVKGLAIEVGPLSLGYAKLQEIRRYISFFRASGKFTVAFMKQAGEKEYYLASACQELYAPPTASISLRGFVVGGTFLRGVLDKVGVEPQVQRIGAFKSAGDQLLRRSMAQEQRVQLCGLLDDTYDEFVRTVAQARGKTEQEVKELLDSGLYDTEAFFKAGWLDGLRYEDELIDDLKKRTAPDDKPEKPLRRVALRKIASVSPSAYGLNGKKRIVVLRAAGAIVGKSSGTGATITPDSLIPILRALAKDKGVAAVVLRVDSPGGDALASDLMWREIKKLGEKKPVIASMADVAASGGYYLSMAAHKIVAEPLTITGSIGVVTGKFNLAELYGKIGYAKELISRGKYAELLADNRAFNKDEAELFETSAMHAYESFRNKAASSRGMTVEAMQAVAQGRVWSGRVALQQGLVDALGGVHAAVQLAKAAAGIEPTEQVTLVELGRSRPSPLALLQGGATAALAALAGPTQSMSVPGLVGLLLAPLLTNSSMPASQLNMSAGPVPPPGSSSFTAGAALGGIASSLGASTAWAVAAAGTAGAQSSPFGISYAAEPEALVVAAAGSSTFRPASAPSSWAAATDDAFLQD